MGWADASDVCDSPPALIGGTFLNVHMWLTVECVVCLAKIIRIYWGVPKFLKINGLRCYRIENTHARADRVLTLKVMLGKKTPAQTYFMPATYRVDKNGHTEYIYKVPPPDC